MSIRVHKLAKELKLSSKDLIEKLRSLKISVKGHMSAIDENVAENLRRKLSAKTSKKTEKKKESKKIEPKKEKLSLPKVEEKKVEEKIEPTPKAKEEKIAPLKPLEIELPLTIKQLSVKLGIKPSALIASLMKRNIFATINQNLDEALAREIAASYGYEIQKTRTLEEELVKEHEDDSKIRVNLMPRFPVVTFMGHVDHGKTSLLDYIRKTKIVAREKGGITQHIGAYKINLSKGSVTFLDTPGHEAFTAMRARGANATDIVVLVVAADDGVMPQTKEAIDHAKAAKVPIVVAINKCDLPNINLDKTRRQLSEHGLISEEWGGKTIMLPVSAKTGEGVDNLLEMLLLEAELLELKANPNIHARGVVIEAKLSPGQGVVTTLLVKNGTLKTGDAILSGVHYGKIKAMIDDKARRIQEASPSTPIEILGLSGVPEAGDEFFVVKDEKKARTLSLLKQEEKRQKNLRSSQRVSLEHLYAQIKEGKVKEFKIILKADVQGSVEALQKSLEVLSTEDVKLKVTHVGVGNINESDVMLAVVTQAVIIGFHVKIDAKAQEVAEKEMVDVKRYDIIYETIDDVRAAMEGLLEPVIKEVLQGKAKVQQVFKVSKIGFVAGSIVVKGKITRSNPIRLIRAGKEIYRGRIRSLKRFKDDAKDVSEGIECGIALEGRNDVKAGDIIESFVIEKVARKLEKKKRKA